MDYIGIANISNIFMYTSQYYDDLSAIHYLSKANEICEDSDIYEKLAIEYEELFYGDIQHNYDEDELVDNIIYCYEMALTIDNNNTKIMFNYANFWKDYDVNNMLKYLKLGASKNDLSCIISLAAYYYENGSKIEWLKYCLRSDCYNKDYEDLEGELHYRNV